MVQFYSTTREMRPEMVSSDWRDWLEAMGHIGHEISQKEYA